MTKTEMQQNFIRDMIIFCAVSRFGKQYCTHSEYQSFNSDFEYGLFLPVYKNEDIKIALDDIKDRFIFQIIDLLPQKYRTNVRFGIEYVSNSSGNSSRYINSTIDFNVWWKYTPEECSIGEF